MTVLASVEPHGLFMAALGVIGVIFRRRIGEQLFEFYDRPGWRRLNVFNLGKQGVINLLGAGYAVFAVLGLVLAFT